MSNSIAVQAAVGDPGHKATTMLSFGFNSLCEINGHQFGANDLGLFRLNDGTTDNGTVFTSKIVLATTDFGIEQNKRFRFVKIGFEALSTDPFTLYIWMDGVERSYTVTPRTNGPQRIVVPIGRDGQGRYCRVSISTVHALSLDHLSATIYTRSSGIKGY